MAFPIGDSRINPNPCIDVPEEMSQWSQDVADTINNMLVLIDEGGVADAFTFKDTTDGTAGFWDEKVLGEGIYDEGMHQQVFYQLVGNQVFMFTVAGGEGGGDTYQVKVTSGGASGFLDTKIHADTYQSSDTYDSGTHFITLAANVLDSVRFYAPYNIIKNSAGDGAQGYLAEKFANPGTYSADEHIQALSQDLGSFMQFFVQKSAINVQINDYLYANFAAPSLRITNVSGSAKSAKYVTALTGAVQPSYASADLGSPIINSSAPVAGAPFALWLDATTTSGATQTAPARAVGPAIATVNITDESHEYCKAITDDYTKLISSETKDWGKILSKASTGTGDKTCAVLLGPFDEGGGGGAGICIAIATELIAAGTGDGSMRTAASGGATPFLGSLPESGDIQNYTLTGIPSGSFIVVAGINGENVAIGAWC